MTTLMIIKTHATSCAQTHQGALVKHRLDAMPQRRHIAVFQYVKEQKAANE